MDNVNGIKVVVKDAPTDEASHIEIIAEREVYASRASKALAHAFPDKSVCIHYGDGAPDEYLIKVV